MRSLWVQTARPVPAYLRHYGLNLSEDNFTCYADHTVTHWAPVRQGMGIGAMMDEIVRETPGTSACWTMTPVRFPVRLVSHRAAHIAADTGGV